MPLCILVVTHALHSHFCGNKPGAADAPPRQHTRFCTTPRQHTRFCTHTVAATSPVRLMRHRASTRVFALTPRQHTRFCTHIVAATSPVRLMRHRASTRVFALTPSPRPARCRWCGSPAKSTCSAPPLARSSQYFASARQAYWHWVDFPYGDYCGFVRTKTLTPGVACVYARLEYPPQMYIVF